LGVDVFLPEENDIGRTGAWKVKLDKFRSAVRWKIARTVTVIAQRLYIKLRCFPKMRVHPEQMLWI